METTDIANVPPWKLFRLILTSTRGNLAQRESQGTEDHMDGKWPVAGAPSLEYKPPKPLCPASTPSHTATH